MKKGKAPLEEAASLAISNEDSSWDQLSEAEEKSMQIAYADVEKKVLEAMKKYRAPTLEEIDQDLALASPLTK